MCKKKDKAIGESSGFGSFEKTQEDMAADHKLETPKSPKLEAEMASITFISMEEYKKRMREDTRPGLVKSTNPATKNFELKGHILARLKDIPVYGIAYKHIDEVNDIADYFNIPNVPCETVLFRMLPITFKGEAKRRRIG